jgi:hypothetical protein
MMIHLAKAFEMAKSQPLTHMTETNSSSAGTNALPPGNPLNNATILNSSPAAVPTRNIPLRTRS